MSYSGARVPARRLNAELANTHLKAVGRILTHVAVAQKPVPKGNPGKWKYGFPKTCGLLSDRLISSHTHVVVLLLGPAEAFWRALAP